MSWMQHNVDLAPTKLKNPGQHKTADRRTRSNNVDLGPTKLGRRDLAPMKLTNTQGARSLPQVFSKSLWHISAISIQRETMICVKATRQVCEVDSN
jgi:hypothetical protein